jgi:NADH-quinone oxidoreductase subunit C
MNLENLEKKLGKDLLGREQRNPRRLTLHIHPDALLSTASELFSELGFRFIIASALHTPVGFEIYYHFSYDPDGLILNLHVVLPQKDPQIESLSNMFEASNWIEREMHELFGIVFLNHPMPERLLSEGNWAEGEYPYRKDFQPKEGTRA